MLNTLVTFSCGVVTGAYIAQNYDIPNVTQYAKNIQNDIEKEYKKSKKI